MKHDFTSTSIFDGSAILDGDERIPGISLPKDFEALLPFLFTTAKNFGLDYYDTNLEWMAFDGISEVAAYDGFPQRYPHWRFGMAFEELSKGYEFGMQRIYELVINTDPCTIYFLNSNTFTDNVTVLLHALGHNDFFKNNVFFKPTNTKMMNEFGNNRTRIMSYMSRWGDDRVEAFIDDCHAIETLVDPAKAWHRKEHEDPITYDKRSYRFPRRLEVPDGHEYMDEWLNPKEWIEQEYEDIKKQETKDYIGIVEMADKDIMGFLRDNAPLKPWEQDTLALMYDEAMYFQPQRMTKMLNEGWASYVDFNLMARMGMPGCSIWHYADHKASVLGGVNSQNPYKIGFELLMDIEERWNKGRFGREYDQCRDMYERSKWDKQLGLGHQKVFEVREQYNDVTALAEYFTEDFCKKHNFFNWSKFPSHEHGVEAEYRIVDRDWKKARDHLIARYLNGGLPYIKLVDPNGKGKSIMVLEHEYDGRPLQPKYSKETMRSLARIWRNPVALLTKNKDGKDIVFYCTPDTPTRELKRNEYQQL